MNYTPAQKLVLEDNSKNLLVSASAGSGKTATITQKIVNLILGGESVEDMLIITFTDAASTEMKVRLRAELEKIAPNNEFCLKELSNLSVCDISTLHAFCSKMVKKFFYFVDVKPNFDVLDDADCSFLKAKALDKVFARFAKQNDVDFQNLLAVFGGGRSFETLKRCVVLLEDFLNCTQKRDEFVLHTATCGYDANFEQNKACEFLQKHLLSRFVFFCSEVEETLQTCKFLGAKKFEVFLTAVQKELHKVDEKNSFLQNQKKVFDIKWPILPSRGLDEQEEEIKNNFKPFWDALKDEIAFFKKIFVNKDQNQIEQELLATKKVTQKFLQIEDEFEKEYHNLKKHKNSLDFADLEKYFLKLLQIEEVKHSFDYKHIFVDEYQDINAVQEEILQKLSSSTSKMVLVGDVKQSIYGFRNSSPQIFATKSKTFGSEEGQERMILLNQNFRSNPVVLQFVNKIFEKVMTAHFGGVNYAMSSMLESDVVYQNENFSPVEVDIFDKSKPEDEFVYDDVYSVFSDKNCYGKSLSDETAEANFVAQKIFDMLGTKVFDAKLSQMRTLDFCDFAVLCRDNAFLKKVAQVLQQKQIPIATNMAQNVFDDADVSVLLSLLKLINNFHDDESLAVVLHSIVGGFSFDEMAQIRARYKDFEFFYQSFLECSKKEDLLAQKAREFFQFVVSLREQLSFKTIFELLSDVCDRFGFFDYVLSLPNGESRCKLVKDFVDGFEGKDFGQNLVEYLDFASDYSKSRGAKKHVSPSNAVSLSTIHASKGLEFPVVFVVGCGKDFSYKSMQSKVIFDEKFGIGLKSFDTQRFVQTTNFARSAVELHKRKMEKEEELRLLYVALTRAKNKLVVLGSAKIEQLFAKSEGANNYLSWILNAFSAINVKNVALNKKSFFEKIAGVNVPFEVINKKDFAFEESKEKQFDKICLSDKTSKDNEQLLIEKEIEKPQKIALKNTVSSILKDDVEIGLENFDHSPKNLGIFETSKIDASQFGSAMHMLMEKIDFENLSKENFEAVLNSLPFEQKILKRIHFEDVKCCVLAVKSFGKKLKLKKEVPFMSFVLHEDLVENGAKSKILVQGVADLLVHADGKWFLVDYKTNKTGSTDWLVEKYYTQIKIYKLCLERALGICFDGAYIYSFAMKKMIKIF